MPIVIKQKIKRLLATFYYPLYRIIKILNKNPKLIILIYHSVNPDHRWSISPKNFEEQIKWLADNYPIISLKNFPNFQKDSIAITFDDGYEDNYLYTFPILKKYNCPATIFITTGFITKEIDITQQKNHCYKGLKPLSIEQIIEMSKYNIDFGCHTHTHSILSKIPPEIAESEITKSKQILERILNQSVGLFAYPNGQPSDFNKETKSILEKNNFRLACSTIHGSNFKNTDPLSLYRIRIDPFDNLNDFKQKISGAWDFINFFQKIKSWL
ncbi:MAG: polysaccharide deacetylase family protein [Minisyncoccia bacterium]